jgi:hypothetical protein
VASALGLSEAPEVIAGWLSQAKDAHHAYEAETGKPDEDWAGWYARFIADRFLKQ